MYNRQLDAFITAADCGSFTKAAEKLFTSPGSVMKQVNTLEQSIGVKLLERTSQGVFLTDVGQYIYQEALDIIQASQLAVHRAQQLANFEPYQIRIGTSALRSSQFASDLYIKLGKLLSAYQLTLVSIDDQQDISTILESGESKIDCFIGPCDSIEWQSRFNIYPLGMTSCQIAVPRAHRLAGKKMLTWDDLSGESLILIKKGISPVIDSLRTEIGQAHTDVHIVDTPDGYTMNTFNECAKKGYLMEIPKIWGDIHPALVSLPVDWNYQMVYGIVYKKNPSPVFSAFIQLVDMIFSEQ